MVLRGENCRSPGWPWSTTPCRQGHKPLVGYRGLQDVFHGALLAAIFIKFQYFQFGPQKKGPSVVLTLKLIAAHGCMGDMNCFWLFMFKRSCLLMCIVKHQALHRDVQLLGLRYLSSQEAERGNTYLILRLLRYI